MGTTEIGAEKAKLEYAKIASGEDKAIISGVIRSLASIAGARAKAYSALSGETADLKAKMLDTVGRFQASQHAGEGAQRMRSTVEMAKLLVNAPVDFAKAAYAPDESMLRDVRMAANLSGDTNTRKKEIAQPAWEAFYTNYVGGAGNVWGTYRAMEEQYGKDVYDLTGDGNLVEKRQRVLAQLDTEKGAAEGFQERYRAFADIDGAWQNFLARNPQLDPNADATYDAFEADNGIKDRLAKVQDTPFIAQLQKTVANLDTGREDLYRKDALAGIKGLDAEAQYLKDMLPKDEKAGPVLTEDTERDLMAAWLKRPEIQAWAKQNGLKVGRVEEITKKQKDDLAAGKIPQSSVTKYGILTDGPDDDKAVEFAYNQRGRTPERDIFRAAGITRGGGPNTVVEVEVGVDPAPYRDPTSGAFLKDTATGKYVKLADAEAAEAAGTPMALELVPDPPPKQIRRGVRRPMLINDAVGSVRLRDEETGREEYVAPEHVRRINEPNLRSDATRDTPADFIGKAVARGAVKKAGFIDENDMDIGEKPDQRRAFFQQYPGTAKGSSVQARRERSEVLEALPRLPDAAMDERFRPVKNTDAFVEEHSQRAKVSAELNPTRNTTLQGERAPVGGDQKVGDLSLDELKKRPLGSSTFPSTTRPATGPLPSGVVTDAGGSTQEAPTKAAAGTTTPRTTTPTAGTDPRRAMFKTRKYRTDETENAGP